MESGVTALRVVLLDGMKGDNGFLGWLGVAGPAEVDGRVFFGIAPEGTPFPRVTIDAPFADPNNLVGFDGWFGSNLVHFWVAGEDESIAVEGAEHFQRIFHDAVLAVPGREFLQGEALLRGTARDPEVNAVQAMIEYTHWLVEPA